MCRNTIHSSSLLAFAAAAFCSLTPVARADVQTNVWINPAGGTWSDAANWQDGNVAISTTVADFRQLASGSTVTITADTYVGGLVFDGDDGDSWTINVSGGARLILRTSLFGYTPIYVGAGTLTTTMYVIFQEDRIVRKEGAGTFVAGNYFPYSNAWGNKVIVADGAFTCSGQRDLFQANVHVTGTGSFVVPNYAGLWLGSYSSDNGQTLDVDGLRVLLGTPNDTQLASNDVEGEGTLVSLAGSTITAYGANPGMTYEAREGVFQFGEKFMVGHWAFDDDASPGRDSSGAGNDLAVSNSVTIVDDSTRGKVALFGAESSLFGTGPNRSINMMPVGTESYTIAAWVKMGSSTTTKAALFFWGPLPVQNNKGLLCRRSGTAIYGGHGGTGAYGLLNLGDGAWHHVAITYDGTTRTITAYGDGVQLEGQDEHNINPRIYNESNASSAENFAIGFPWSTSADYPEGMMMDDAMFFGKCLSAAEVAQLKNGTLSYDYPVLPEGVGLSTFYNGELHLFGDQTISEIGGDGVLGGVKVLAGETLTITGAVDKAESVYGADIAGNVSLVKDAPTKVRLTGGLSYTGSTRVKAGTLALGSYAINNAPFVAYDFEDTNLGLDSTGRGRNLTVSGATRVWDAERGSWVARFSAGSKQYISGDVNSSEELVGNSDYTLSVWAKPTTSCPSQASFLSFGVNSSNFKQIQFRFNTFSARTLVLAHWGGTYDFTAIPSGVSSTDYGWHHYVAVRNGTSFKVYVDGVEKWSTTKSGSGLDFPTLRKLYIGSFFNTNDSRYFDGDIDDVYVFGHALDADAIQDLYARAKPMEAVPDPVLHYAFEEAANPGMDSSGSGCDLTATGTLTCEDSPIGGKALVFDTSAVSYLSAPLPSAIPAAGSPMTITFWAQHGGASEYNSGSTYPTFVSWGDPSAKTMDFMFAFSVDSPWRPRLYMPGVYSVDNAYDLLWNPSAPDEMRWHHFAISYDPVRGLNTYFDGQRSSGLSTGGQHTSQRTATTFYLGLKPTALTHPFRGRLDEVKVYDVALTKAQVRAAIRAERHLGSRVLPDGTAVTVDAGATLAVDGGVHGISSLSGAGSVTLAPYARLNLSAPGGFTGTVTGEGVVGIADNAVVEFGDGSAPLIDIDHPFTLGANVTVNTTATQGRNLIVRAPSFTGVENLETWAAEVGNRTYSFVVSRDGTELSLSMISPTILLLR